MRSHNIFAGASKCCGPKPWASCISWVRQAEAAPGLPLMKGKGPGAPRPCSSGALSPSCTKTAPSSSCLFPPWAESILQWEGRGGGPTNPPAPCPPGSLARDSAPNPRSMAVTLCLWMSQEVNNPHVPKYRAVESSWRLAGPPCTPLTLQQTHETTLQTENEPEGAHQTSLGARPPGGPHAFLDPCTPPQTPSGAPPFGQDGIPTRPFVRRILSESRVFPETSTEPSDFQFH